jgi:Carboxypeptidase regulatory-like domain
VTATTATSFEGLYRFSLLKPGRYEVSSSASGFVTVAIPLTVVIGQAVSADIKLEISKTVKLSKLLVSVPLISTDPATPPALPRRKFHCFPAPVETWPTSRSVLPKQWST